MKVLIIGLGAIAKKHIAALNELIPNVELFALRSNQSSNSIRGIKDYYEFKELINVRFDFIIISTPTSKHFEIINLCKNLDTPLFIEKPLFHHVGEKEKQLVSLISGIGINTYVACNLRFLDCLIKLKEFIRNKRVNEVNIYCGSYLPDWRPEANFRKIYSVDVNLGGGVHIDLIHELDYLYWLFGAPLNSKSFFQNKSSLDIASYDYANYLWQYDRFSANIVLNYYRRDPKRTLEIICEDGTFFVDLLENTIIFNKKLIFSSSQRISDTYNVQMKFYLEQILGKHLEFNSIVEAYNILKLCIEN